MNEETILKGLKFDVCPETLYYINSFHKGGYTKTTLPNEILQGLDQKLIDEINSLDDQTRFNFAYSYHIIDGTDRTDWFHLNFYNKS